MLAALLISVSALLDVPFMAQPPDLCGGAAVAMVMRYWGTADVFPQDFAPLADKDAAGIPSSALLSATRARGWQANVLPTDAATGRTDIETQLRAGRPLIALIEVAPRTYHYVVIVGATADEVVVHDPARAPFRVVRWTDFDREWAATERWLMLMLPPVAPAAAPTPSAAATTAAKTPCSAMTDGAVQLALDGHAQEAEQSLGAAIRLCPADPAPLCELAGLRFSQRRWQDAEDLAARAIAIAPANTYAWQLTATARYMAGRPDAALEAWNHAGEPRVDTIDVRGAERTPQPVIAHALALEPRALLTRDALERAARRLNALPVANSARVSFTPIDGGRAQITVAIDEKPLMPHGWWTAANLGARALISNDTIVTLGGALDRGDVIYGYWRWLAGLPRLEAGLAMPAPGHLPGVLSFDAAWEKQSYAANAADVTSETRRRAALHLSDWATGRLQWRASAALDRFGTSGTAHDYVAIDGGLQLRLLDDHAAIAAAAGWWTPFSGSDRFSSSSVTMGLRSTTDATATSLSARATVATTSDIAPRALWQGAGTGLGRDLLLRAHPLFNNGVIDGPLIGRTIAQGTLELTRPIDHLAAGAVALAAFADAAQAWRRPDGNTTSALYIDAGVGVRLRLPGQSGGLRLDVAHGLRGGAWTFSASLLPGWFR